MLVSLIEARDLAVHLVFHAAHVAIPGVDQLAPTRAGKNARKLYSPSMRKKSMYMRVLSWWPDVAKDVEARDQQVVDALEQRIADDPRGLRRPAHQALDHRSAVEVAEAQ